MNISIGENLRRLRKSGSITQERLAEILGISFQSVSKWERGEGYPDITMLAAIANFFEVSTDELLGMEKFRDKVKLGEMFGMCFEYLKNEKYSEAEELVRGALKYYPNNYSVMISLVHVLANKASESDFDSNEKSESISEAILLCRRIWDECKNEKVRSTAVSSLCYLYRMAGDNESADGTAKNLPHIWESREMIWPDVQDDAEREKKLKKSVSITLSVLYDKIKAAKDQDRRMPKMISFGPAEYEPDEMIRVITNFIK